METVVITGANGGLGIYLVKEYLKKECKVFALDKDISNMKSIQNDKLVSQEIDVTNEEEWLEFTNKLSKLDIKINYLINAAGILRLNKIENTSLKEWLTVMSVNTTGVFLSLKHISPFLTKNSSVVIISSIASFLGSRDRIAYAASKGAVASMTKAISIEWAPREIRVNSIHPAYIKTQMADIAGEYTNRTYDKMGERIPLYNRISDVSEIADVVLFLTSDASRFMTGAELVVDGGQSVN
ncbi:SDR family NAD(P)-dependent oxidoreductase [Aerococcus urinae]|uniref:SDR family NAD(P)-dependent oxidoreductase n=1 Tax=Aerococcus urinae TaxID=1376 RepID=UPI00254FB4B2|nr:SDR family oxidoreductase [Aerococcus urinae]MDK6375278.1 SDR family oxidoreductase [Aerococcus urinae]MDK6420126.1 SDR family oxidoreductase [Aerococcus urinae]MDK8075619.1 SDR family oxidoreductase [Aerococcus urinae]MDK8084612.1 SDR family oxidoreductase [Aerococcus urinae]